MVLKIFKMIASSGFLTALECTKFVLGRGFVPDPTVGGGLQRSPYPLAGLMGPTFMWYREMRKMGKGESKGKGWEREGLPPFRRVLDPPM